VETKKFDSIGLNYLLHCVPGDIQPKSIIFKHLKALMKPDGVIFGSTILGKGVNSSLLARCMIRFLEPSGIINNSNDDIDGLKEGLSKHFRQVKIEVVGSVALFSAGD